MKLSASTKFKKGDHVIVTQKNDWVEVGVTGTVNRIDSNSFSANWENTSTYWIDYENAELTLIVDSPLYKALS
jgi:hypothetical protein